MHSTDFTEINADQCPYWYCADGPGHIQNVSFHTIYSLSNSTICCSYMLNPLPLPTPTTLSPTPTLSLLLLPLSPAPSSSHSPPPPPTPFSLPYSSLGAMLTTFSFLSPYFSLQLAKDAEQVNKNIKKQCWNVWYEAYLLSSDESSTGPNIPGTPALSSGARRSSSNFENAPIASAVLNSSGLRKSRKVYCYISKKVCMYLWFSSSFQTHGKISCCFVVTLVINYLFFVHF